VIAISNFREPGFAISQQPAPRCPGHADPLLADSRDRLRDLVISSLNRTDLRSYGPEPDWIAAVMRAWMSFALIISRFSLIPSAFSHCGTICS
jgi:hypothetical protein